jgi:large subunit ribosomal protein L25
MAHETPTIAAQTRERTGTRFSKRLRQSGRLPAVIYGHGADPVAVSVNSVETLNHLKHGAHVINVEVEGKSAETCLVKDLQFGFLGDNIIHVDFTRVDLDETVTVNVHLDFHGELGNIKEVGAVLVQDLTEIEVSCAVRDIPESIRVSLDGHEMSVAISEIEFPKGVTPIASLETSVVHITIQAEEVEEPVEGEATALDDAAATDGDATPTSEDSSDG